MSVGRRGQGVSSPRRPDGWAVPGPPPRGFDGSAELVLQEGESLDLLAGDWRIFQPSKGHRWSLEDLLTADLAAAVAGEHPVADALDLGCGLGSVLLLLAWRLPRVSLVGLEAQGQRASMASRSVRWNGVEQRVRVEQGDLRALGPQLHGRFDLVTGTPPYFPAGTAVEPASDSAAACRFEHRGGVEAYLEAGRAAMRDSGHLVLCASALELDRLEAASARSRLVRLRRTVVIPREGKPPLVTIDLYALQGTPSAPQELVVRDHHGQWTDPMRALRTRMGLPDRPPAG